MNHFKKLGDCLNRVYRKRESFELVKNSVPYAHLVPVADAGCSSHELADDLDAAEFSPEERRSFSAAIRNGRKRLKPLKSAWA